MQRNDPRQVVDTPHLIESKTGEISVADAQNGQFTGLTPGVIR